jgi:hypothetical protein
MFVCESLISFGVHDQARAVGLDGPDRYLFSGIQVHLSSKQVEFPGVSRKARDTPGAQKQQAQGLLRCCHRHHLQHSIPLV